MPHLPPGLFFSGSRAVLDGALHGQGPPEGHVCQGLYYATGATKASPSVKASEPMKVLLRPPPGLSKEEQKGGSIWQDNMNSQNNDSSWASPLWSPASLSPSSPGGIIWTNNAESGSCCQDDLRLDPAASTDVSTEAVLSDTEVSSTDIKPDRVAVTVPSTHNARPKGEQHWKGPSRKPPAAAQWWHDCLPEKVCPLSGFPIALLPYPPFKFRKDPVRPEGFILVDGKYLAMQFIATGRSEVCGRQLTWSDIKSLDTYVRRCSLGPFRPYAVLELQLASTNSEMLEEREMATKKLARLQERAWIEMRKLRRIQAQRLHDIHRHVECDPSTELSDQTGLPHARGQREGPVGLACDLGGSVSAC